MAFMPPAVELPQPPIKAIRISMTGRIPGHAPKSSVVKPAVVAIEMTWKIPLVIAVPGSSVRVTIRIPMAIAQALSSTPA